MWKHTTNNASACGLHLTAAQLNMPSSLSQTTACATRASLQQLWAQFSSTISEFFLHFPFFQDKEGSKDKQHYFKYSSWAFAKLTFHGLANRPRNHSPRWRASSLGFTLPYKLIHRSNTKHNTERGGFCTSSADTSGSTKTRKLFLQRHTINRMEKSACQFLLPSNNEENCWNHQWRTPRTG